MHADKAKKNKKSAHLLKMCLGVSSSSVLGCFMNDSWTLQETLSLPLQWSDGPWVKKHSSRTWAVSANVHSTPLWTTLSRGTARANMDYNTNHLFGEFSCWLYLKEIVVCLSFGFHTLIFMQIWGLTHTKSWIEC